MSDATPTCIQIRAALRHRATSVVNRDNQHGMLLAVRDVSGVLTDFLVAAWMGPEGMAFMEANRADLVAGRCVDLEIFRLRAIATQTGPELAARIKSCVLAPEAPSHIKHKEKSQQEQHA